MTNVIDYEHLSRQKNWSVRTFGPGQRLQGVIKHIKKELKEVKKKPEDITEWADVIILAFDGAWRSGHGAQEIIDAIVAKQQKNEGRVWPDWRNFGEGEAIEHDRTYDNTSHP